MAALTADLTAPTATLVFSVADRNAAMADLSAPMPTLVAWGGAQILALAPTAMLEASGSVRTPLFADLVAPVALLEAAASVGRALSADLVAPRPVLAAWGGAQIVALAPLPMVEASANSGHALQARLVAPMAQVAIEASAHPGFIADLVAPAARLLPDVRAVLSAPMPHVYAELQPVVVPSYEAWAVNLRSQLQGGGGEATHYSDYPFVRIVRFANRYYGVAADGLYLLGGDLDRDQPVAWALCTATTDFDTSKRKNPASCYLGGRIGTPVAFTVMTGEDRENRYQYRSPRHETAQNHRQKFGRGLNARYYTFQIEGDGPLELDDITFELNVKTRSI